MHDHAAARIVADKIAKMIYDQVDPINHSMTASIGVSIYPKDGVEAEALLTAADLSMYAAKQQNDTHN